jgi:hypothetical protein
MPIVPALRNGVSPTSLSPQAAAVRDVTPVPEPLTRPWWLQHHPDRPLDEHATICACATCEAAIHAQAAIIPGISIGLKTAASRIRGHARAPRRGDW